MVWHLIVLINFLYKYNIKVLNTLKLFWKVLTLVIEASSGLTTIMYLVYLSPFFNKWSIWLRFFLMSSIFCLYLKTLAFSCTRAKGSPISVMMKFIIKIAKKREDIINMNHASKLFALEPQATSPIGNSPREIKYVWMIESRNF